MNIDEPIKYKVPGNPLTIWKWRGQLMVDGLFRMHDEKGFSLTDSLIECKKRNLIPCLDQFRADALKAGWSNDKIDRVIGESSSDFVTDIDSENSHSIA